MCQILLASSARSLRVEGRSFAVCAKGWDPPPGVPAVEVEAVVAEPERYFGEPGTMVVCGLSRLNTPTNRVRLGQVLHRQRPGITRLSVDDRLFVIDPWRMFWHFIAVGADYRGLTDSFLAETKWLAAREQQTPDPFSLDEVKRWGAGVIRCIDPFEFADPILEVREVSAGVREKYAAEKALAFEEEPTIQGIIRRLAAIAATAEPSRTIPTKAGLFRVCAGSLLRERVRIVRTDLPVDALLTGEVLHLIALTNGIAESFR